MKQSSRLAHISRRAKEIRLAHARGDISHEERMAQLHDLVTGPSLRQRLAALFRTGRKNYG
jgi:hypothetical protein